MILKIYTIIVKNFVFEGRTYHNLLNILKISCGERNKEQHTPHLGQANILVQYINIQENKPWL